MRIKMNQIKSSNNVIIDIIIIALSSMLTTFFSLVHNDTCTCRYASD